MARGKKRILALLSASLAAILAWAHWPLAPLPKAVRADKAVVYKAERRLVLMSGGREIASYPVALGPKPSGHKEREGAGRSPEGLYVLDDRNPNSAFHLSLHVSYPDARDRQAAAQGGLDSGGLVMVHGLPNRGPFLSTSMKKRRPVPVGTRRRSRRGWGHLARVPAAASAGLWPGNLQETCRPKRLKP